MICIVQIVDGDNITGWIIATDVADARRQAGAALEDDLVRELDRVQLEPPRGKHRMETANCWMLVS